MKQIQTTIALTQLEIYPRCPAQYNYFQKRGGISTVQLLPKTKLFRDIACSTYLKAARNTRINPWRQMTAQIDKFTFADLLPRSHPDYDSDVDTKFKLSLSRIDALKKHWYRPYFLAEGMEGFSGLKTSLSIGGYNLVDTTDLVLFNEKDLILCKFTNIETNQSMLYNNIRMRTQALMLSRNLGRLVTKIRSMSWPEDSEKISVRDINIHNPVEFANKTEAVVSHIVGGIRKEIFYPSVSEQCFTCPFNNICSF